MNFEIPPLPYAKDALAPHISARTVDIHYEKHHRGYLRKLEQAIEGKPLADQSLEEIIAAAEDQHVFNVAAQVWNHTFYWRSLAPDAPPEPSGALAEAIDRDFGSLDALSGSRGGVSTSGTVKLRRPPRQSRGDSRLG